MPDEREKILNTEIEKLEEQTKVLAEKMQELIGVDCNFGACVFDPAMSDVEGRLADVQRRKKTLEKIMSDLDACET